MNDPGICRICAMSGPTCCQLRPGQEQYCFPLSAVEVDRIRDFAPERGWFVQEANSAQFVEHVSRLFPGERSLVASLFHPRKFHNRLAVDRGGSCVFLSETGCTLPTEARPYYCRIFPLWFSGDRLMILSADCTARQRSRSTAGLLESLDMTIARARDLHARLRLAWGLPPRKGMPLAPNQLAGNHK